MRGRTISSPASASRIAPTPTPAVCPGASSAGSAVARALINAPPLLLADEPTSDLDEDTETDIIDLLEQLQRTEAFGFVLVTHDLKLAKRAQRSYEMRQGPLAGIDLPQVAAEPQRRLTPAKIRSEPTVPAAARAPIRLGANLWGAVKGFLIASAVIFAAILAADIGVEKYQAMRVRER